MMPASTALPQQSQDRRVLWWGRFDPKYSRNQILRQILPILGWQITDFYPVISSLGDVDATLRRLPVPDLVWVPCFRQRDIRAARRWSHRHGIPLLIDPLISSYDKQIFERQKLSPHDASANRLLAWERTLVQSADMVLVDTNPHADFFGSLLGAKHTQIVYVGAEEDTFTPCPPTIKSQSQPFEVLFYGSFIPLHGADVIIEAARQYAGPPAIWRMIGRGPLLRRCQQQAAGLSQVFFEEWVPYSTLKQRIANADIVLGVFGNTPKAGRVIPNKVFQALACARPVITRYSPAYPQEITAQSTHGITWVEANDAPALAAQVAALLEKANQLAEHGLCARKTYERYFAQPHIARQLQSALSRCVDGH